MVKHNNPKKNKLKKQLKQALQATKDKDPRQLIDNYQTLLQVPQNQQAVISNLLRASLQIPPHPNAIQIAKLALEKYPSHIQVTPLAIIVLAKNSVLAIAKQQLLKWLELHPDDMHLMGNYGYACYQANAYREAMEWMEKGLAQNPTNLDIVYNLSQVYVSAYQVAKALDLLEQYHDKYPHDIKLQYNLAVIYKNQGELSKAKAYLHHVLQAHPDNLQSLVLLADIYKTREEFDKAQATIQTIYQSAPNHIDALLLEASMVLAWHRFEEALTLYKKCLTLEKKQNPLILGRIVRAAREVLDWSTVEAVNKEIHQLQNQLPNLEPMHPFDAIMLADSPTLTRLVAKRMSQFIQRQTRKVFPITFQGDKPKKIGYISPDFSTHAVGLLLNDLLTFHDRLQFEVVVIPTKRYDDAFHRTILDSADSVEDVSGLSPYEAAYKIKAKEIDILIDLAGYSQNNSMSILAHRPAAMQCHWLGYPGTLGADFIDYLIADPYLAPAEIHATFSEKVLPIEHEYATQGFGESRCTQSKADYQLPDDKFIFCCHHRPYRIDSDVVLCWFEILRQVPNSVLWLSGFESTAKQRFLQAAREASVAPHRFIFSPYIQLTEHWAHQLADLWLDTFLMTGGTSIALCQWVCLPVVSMRGHGMQTRVSNSICHATGVPEQIVDSFDGYIQKAVSLATNPEAYQRLKEKIISQKQQAPLYQTKLWMQKFEASLCQGYKNLREKKDD